MRKTGAKEDTQGWRILPSSGRCAYAARQVPVQLLKAKAFCQPVLAAASLLSRADMLSDDSSKALQGELRPELTIVPFKMEK